jgi:hypothetical protein
VFDKRHEADAQHFGMNGDHPARSNVLQPPTLLKVLLNSDHYHASGLVKRHIVSS